MSSILTNNGAMVALQTLKSTNQNMSTVQREIATGKSVGSAKDNAAVWAISKVMESDVTGFKAISANLSRGESTVSVARAAAESTTDLLTQIKDKVIQAQEVNGDEAAKIQADIVALRDQVKQTISAAQFNGVNLVDGNGGTYDIVSSLDRADDGTVKKGQIQVESINLSTAGGTDLTAATVTDAGADGLINGGGVNNTVVINALQFQQADGTAAGAVAQPKDGINANPAMTTDFIEGDIISMTIGNTKASYTIRAGDISDTVLGGLKNSLADAGVSTDDFTFDVATNGALTITNNTSADVAFDIEMTRGTGGLAALDDINVVTNAAGALEEIEGLIQTSVDAAAAFGTEQNRIETQSNFVGKLMDSMKSGIGAMVDADMEEASARLQALQVQQQLGIQSLSMANQAPQSLLSLFR